MFLRRALFVAAFIVFWMLAVCARLVYLQVLATRQSRQSRPPTTAARNRDQSAAWRACSIGRSASLPAASRQFLCFSIPRSRHRRRWISTAKQLAQVAGSEAGGSRQTSFAKLRAEKRRFIWIARRLDADQADKIVALKLAGVNRDSEPSVITRTVRWRHTCLALSASMGRV